MEDDALSSARVIQRLWRFMQFEFFSMHAKVNELVLNETKEETMLKIAQKFVKKGKKKTLSNIVKMSSFSP